MKTQKQNNLGTYLAVTASASCAASLAEGAIQVIDLSGLSSGLGPKTLPSATGDDTIDFGRYTNSATGFLLRQNGATFHSDEPGIGGSVIRARGYQSDATFSTDPDNYAIWYAASTAGGGFQVGLNWVAFKDTAGNYGWMSLTLDTLLPNNSINVSYGHYVYDDISTGPADAIDLNTAIAAASVPEPSGLALLALGSAGLAARRQRRKVA